MANSLDLLIIELNSLIFKDDCGSALSLIKSWLDPLALDFRLHGQVFSSPDLDQLCLKIGQNIYNKLNLSSKDTTSNSRTSTILVASELYLSGGHTKVLKDYVNALEAPNKVILVTDPTDTVNHAQINDYFAQASAQIYFSPRFTSTLTKLEWLMRTLHSLAPQETYLFNHANDPIAVAAMQADLVTNLKFVHHCDHTITLGIHLPKATHLDFRPLGFKHCRHNLHITNNKYVPLVTSDLGCPPPSNRFFTQNELHTCTSGAYKFEAPYAFNLMSELPKWLQLTGGIHTHIGELSPSSIKCIRDKLSELGISQQQFKVIPFTSSLWKTLISEQIDLYIDSFPIAGSLSVVEAMGAGIPTAIHHNYKTPLWSNVGFAYPEAFIWQTPVELGNWLSTLNVETLEQHSQLARQHYLKYHQPETLKKSLINIEENDETRPENSLIPAYTTNSLRAYMDQFLPIQADHKKQKELLTQFVGYMNLANDSESSLDGVLKEYLTGYDYRSLVEFISELRTSVDVINTQNRTTPILYKLNKIDPEKFSNLLNKISTQSNKNTFKPLTLSPQLKAKLLMLRIKNKCNSILIKR